MTAGCNIFDRWSHRRKKPRVEYVLTHIRHGAWSPLSTADRTASRRKSDDSPKPYGERSSPHRPDDHDRSPRDVSGFHRTLSDYRNTGRYPDLHGSPSPAAVRDGPARAGPCKIHLDADRPNLARRLGWDIGLPSSPEEEPGTVHSGNTPSYGPVRLVQTASAQSAPKQHQRCFGPDVPERSWSRRSR